MNLLRLISAAASTAVNGVHSEGGDREPDFLAAARNGELVPHCSINLVQHYMRKIALLQLLNVSWHAAFKQSTRKLASLLVSRPLCSQ